MRKRATADRLHEIGELCVGCQLVLAGRSDVEDLAAQWHYCLRLAIARLLGAAAGRVPFDDEEFGAFEACVRAVGELAGKARFLSRSLARNFLLGAAAQPLFGALDDEI